MLLPKEDNVNTRKQGLGFENQNDDVDSSLLNKAKELAPCLYNNDEMGKYLLLDHNIISEELKCTFKKIFQKMEAQSIAFEITLQYKIKENNSLKTMQTENENFGASLEIDKAHLKQTYRDLFESIQSSRDETNQCDDVKLKFNFDEIETQNIELEHQVASLIKENET
ncbi:hypothetical protein Tco_1250638 [Tanacetum coccineum]